VVNMIKRENSQRVQFEFKNPFELDFHCRCTLVATVTPGCDSPLP
jgi:hypothetical protein